MLTILRNQVYVGKIFFRGTYYDGQHDTLISQNLFDRAQAILAERGEDHSLRRSNQSDYLLTGLLRCERCGKKFLGTAAHGNGGRYVYYTCYTRQNYGTEECDADRLPADELDEAIARQLVSVLEQEPLVQQAVREAFAEIESERPRRQHDLVQLDAEIRRTDDALNRYSLAFEQGTLDPDEFGPRMKELRGKRQGLEGRREELSLDDFEAPEAPSEEELLALAADVAEVVKHGDQRQKKALIKGLVREIRVVARDEIYPFFQVPVRPPSGSVGGTGLEPHGPPWRNRGSLAGLACGVRGRRGCRFRPNTSY